MINFMSIKLEIELIIIEDLALIPKMINKQSATGTTSIVIKPSPSEETKCIGYDIEYNYPPHTRTEFYNPKEHPEKFSDHFSRIH